MGDTLDIYSCSISFPEVSLPVIIRIKDFLKKCKVPNYTKQMKTILDKVQETSKLIVQNRKSASFSSLADTNAIEAWESKCREKGTPLSKFYKTYRVARDRELLMDISQKEQFDISDTMPHIERKKEPKKATPDERKEFSELFDEDSDSDDENRFLLKEERINKDEAPMDSNSDDQYSDFDDDELAELDKSASEDASSECDGGSDDESTKNDVEMKNESSESDEIDEDDVVEEFKLSDSE